MARRKKTIKLSNVRGQPKMATALDEKSIEEKVYRESQKFESRLANELHTHYLRLEQIAKGEGEFKDASVTNRKSATCELIERAEAYIYEEGITKQEEAKEEAVVAKVKPLMAV